jgi:hypothetical protein
LARLVLAGVAVPRGCLQWLLRGGVGVGVGVAGDKRRQAGMGGCGALHALLLAAGAA